MRLEWINNRVITAAAVLSFSCVAAAAYTAVKDDSLEYNTSTALQDGFIATMLDSEASLYNIDAHKTKQAQKNLSNFLQYSKANLTAPTDNTEAALRDFILKADRLMQAHFPVSRSKLSVTEAIVQKQGTQALNTWMLLSMARQFGLESSLTAQLDHSHVVLKAKSGQWIEWKLNHLQDMQVVELKPLDEYDLWTALDLSLVKHYVAVDMHSNDLTIEALAKAATMDGHSLQAQYVYDSFLASRGRDAEFAHLKH